MTDGWIKLHRELMDKAIWKCSTPEQKVILITLLMMANHKENEWEWQGEKFNVKPGQFVTSLKSISEACGKGITIQHVRTSLDKFQKLDFLTNKSTKNGRLITLVNWGVYQNGEQQTNIVTNKDLTKHQQRPNKDLTTNKKERKKECENDKNLTTTTSTSEIFKFYENYMPGIITQTMRDKVESYLANGIRPEVIIYGMNIACENEKRTWSYVEGILDKYLYGGIFTMEAVKEAEEKHKKRKNRTITEPAEGVKYKKYEPDFLNMEKSNKGMAEMKELVENIRKGIK